MKTQPKKITLNKETLRDLTVQNAGEVKGGRTNRTCANFTFCVSGANGCYTFHCKP